MLWTGCVRRRNRLSRYIRAPASQTMWKWRGREVYMIADWRRGLCHTRQRSRKNKVELSTFNKTAPSIADDSEYMMRAKTTGCTGGSTIIVLVVGWAVWVIVTVCCGGESISASGTHGTSGSSDWQGSKYFSTPGGRCQWEYSAIKAKVATKRQKMTRRLVRRGDLPPNHEDWNKEDSGWESSGQLWGWGEGWEAIPDQNNANYNSPTGWKSRRKGGAWIHRRHSTYIFAQGRTLSMASLFVHK